MTEPSIDVEVIIDPPLRSPASTERLALAATLAAESQGFTRGQIAIRVTDDKEIRRLNHRHLDHDYATDVISFGYLDERPVIEGELVLSLDTAQRTAATLADWTADQEMMLYVVHGVLHLCGMDDQDEEDRADMRRAERQVLLRLGIPQISRCGADSAPTSEPASFPDRSPKGDR